jgi:AcrR family transcriptional regulator
MGEPVKLTTEADGRRDRWTAHREQRRNEFVQAALRVLASTGPEISMDAVAAEAGVTKPVLYRYFSDKAALVDALGEAGSGFLLDRLLPAMQSGAAPLQRICDAVGAYFAVIDEQPNLYWLLASWPGGNPVVGSTVGGVTVVSNTVAAAGRTLPADSSAAGPPAAHTAAGYAWVQHDRELIATTLTVILGDYLRAFGLDSGGAEPWAYGLTGLVQSTGEWWLRRRSMSRAHVVAYVSELIWAAMSGVLRNAGVVLDPAQPLPPIRPELRIADESRG